jgi:hypothetical protein
MAVVISQYNKGVSSSLMLIPDGFSAKLSTLG